ncbi:MAG: SH3 domain-containing protein [Chloroflexota bacterium]
MRVYLLLLLTLFLFAGLLIGSPTAAQTDPQVTPGLQITPAPTFTPAPTQVPIYVVTPSTGCAAPLPLLIGGDVLLRGGVNIRSEPSLSAALVNYYPTQVRLRLIDGPRCVNGYNWWRIAGVGEPGWVVEGRPGRYFLEQFVDPETTHCFAPLETVQVGGALRTVTGSRVRETPDNDGFVLTVVLNDVQLAVTDGPRCFGGLNWWKVRAPVGNSTVFVEGWIAEGYPGAYFVEGLSASGQSVAAARCLTALRLHAGSRAAVSYDDGVLRHLRAAPGASAPVIADLLDGIAFDVTDDNSICADGYNWWQVRIVATGLTGWLAEGVPGNYWFEVLIR